MFVLKGILRAESQEKILIYLLARETGYGKAIAQFFSTSTNSIQKQLLRLEEDGVVVSESLGATRMYQLNKRYPFISPLKVLLEKALSAYPSELRKRLLIERTRPRKTGKSIELISND